MLRAPESYMQYMERVFSGLPENQGKSMKTFCFQVTEDCTLRCTYCYEPVKYEHYMDISVAKAAVDMLFERAKDPDFVFSYNTTYGIVFEFIGGEPFLAVEMITKIIFYIEKKMIEENSPWLHYHKYSFSTNGTLYFDPRVQNMINTFGNLIGISVTVDGNKELHDHCRKFPDGSGSYDIAVRAALDQKDRFNNKQTKITLSPYNMYQLYPAILNMWNMGFNYVFANCCFEEGWTTGHARSFYLELKKLADYIIDNDYEEVYGTSLFDETSFAPYGNQEDRNWCGGTGQILALDYKGIFYPCIRYMPSSLNGEQPPLTIGNIQDGICSTDKDIKIFQCLRCITRSSQSSEECNSCPIASGCAWCSGYNYQKFGTANKRTTFTCVMHKARALGNLYFWSKYYLKTNQIGSFINHITDEIGLEIVGEEEYSYLKNLWEEAVLNYSKVG